MISNQFPQLARAAWRPIDEPNHSSGNRQRFNAKVSKRIIIIRVVNTIRLGVECSINQFRNMKAKNKRAPRNLSKILVARIEARLVFISKVNNLKTGGDGERASSFSAPQQGTPLANATVPL